MRHNEHPIIIHITYFIYSTHEDIFPNRNKLDFSVKKLTKDETRLLEPL